MLFLAGWGFAVLKKGLGCGVRQDPGLLGANPEP